MTSIAVTASICASASEAALLVASLMPISLDLASLNPGMAYRRASAQTKAIMYVLLGTPLDEHSLQ